MLQEIVIGNAAEALASSASGWVIGHFMKEAITHNEEFEIKIWHYDSQPDYGKKEFKGTEFIIVEKGGLRLELEIPDGQGVFSSRHVELKASTRDYIVIPPNCRKRVVVTEAPAYGITVRWPSGPGVNVVIE